MRIGQTSLVTFLSKFLASAIGFVATIYFARVVGADVLGMYALVLTVVAWTGIAGEVGLTSAMAKRISEGDDRDEYFTAGLLLVIGTFVAVSAVLVGFRSAITWYIGTDVLPYVLVILLVTLLFAVTQATLTGHHLVHVKGYLDPVRISARSVLQVIAVWLGFELTGLLVGYSAGFVVVIVGGILVVRPSLALPARGHFSSLFSFAKYAWLGAVKGRTFGWVDTAVLGLFVSSGLIGIYSVSWTIGTFLLTFGMAISAAIFPEISKVASDESLPSVAPIVRDAVAYSGLIMIPGLVGSAILGERILRIYGPEFVQGSVVLPVLVAACLIYSYQKQLATTLNAIDRPDRAFRVNVGFIGTNVVLNVVLVYLYGWVGAAVATGLSAAVGLVLGYYYLDRIIEFELPVWEIARQCLATLLMGAVVYGGLLLEETHRVLGHNFATVVLLVGLGSFVYFSILFGISQDFRTTVRANLPFDVPA